MDRHVCVKAVNIGVHFLWRGCKKAMLLDRSHPLVDHTARMGFDCVEIHLSNDLLLLEL